MKEFIARWLRRYVQKSFLNIQTILYTQTQVTQKIDLNNLKDTIVNFKTYW